MDYYDSAYKKPITYKRAIQELRKHSLNDEENAALFKEECWDKYSKDGTIQAQRVLDWLGY